MSKKIHHLRFYNAKINPSSDRLASVFYDLNTGSKVMDFKFANVDQRPPRFSFVVGPHYEYRLTNLGDIQSVLTRFGAVTDCKVEVRPHCIELSMTFTNGLQVGYQLFIYAQNGVSTILASGGYQICSMYDMRKIAVDAQADAHSDHIVSLVKGILYAYSHFDVIKFLRDKEQRNVNAQRSKDKADQTLQRWRERNPSILGAFELSRAERT